MYFHQFKLKRIDIIGKRVIAFCQALGLTKEFFGRGSRGQVIDFFLQKVCEFP